MAIDPAKIRSVIATDCGSTTTKAILIEKNAAGEYRLRSRGEAPTTVEAPVEDVTRGVLNAVREIQELRGKQFLAADGERIVIRDAADPDEADGVDLYISTSSAGGGLQMMVAGVVKKMTADSAARAALGAGAIVMDAIATNDKRAAHEKIERIRQLRPDMILMAGGTDGGTVSHVVELAELLRAPSRGRAWARATTCRSSTPATSRSAARSRTCWAARSRCSSSRTSARCWRSRTSALPAMPSTSCSWSTSWPRRPATAS